MNPPLYHQPYPHHFTVTDKIKIIANGCLIDIREKFKDDKETKQLIDSITLLMGSNITSLYHPAFVSKINKMIGANFEDAKVEQVILYKTLTGIRYKSSLDLADVFDTTPKKVFQKIFDDTYQSECSLDGMDTYTRSAIEGIWVLTFARFITPQGRATLHGGNYGGNYGGEAWKPPH